MTSSQEQEIVINLKKVGLIVTVTSATMVMITASFGVFWTYFLKVRVSEQISETIGHEVSRTSRDVRFLKRVLQEANPEAYDRVSEREARVQGFN